mgnify:FL=1
MWGVVILGFLVSVWYRFSSWAALIEWLMSHRTPKPEVPKLPDQAQPAEVLMPPVESQPSVGATRSRLIEQARRLEVLKGLVENPRLTDKETRERWTIRLEELFQRLDAISFGSLELDEDGTADSGLQQLITQIDDLAGEIGATRYASAPSGRALRA